MSNSKKPIMYHCSMHGNFKTQKCPRCNKNCIPVYDIPPVRDSSNDLSYLDYVLKQSKKNNN